MRNPKVPALLAVALAACALPSAAQDAFDACTIFTAEDATKALGTKADPEPVIDRTVRLIRPSAPAWASA